MEVCPFELITGYPERALGVNGYYLIRLITVFYNAYDVVARRFIIVITTFY
jgi:hypothetical protein